MLSCHNDFPGAVQVNLTITELDHVPPRPRDSGPQKLFLGPKRCSLCELAVQISFCNRAAVLVSVAANSSNISTSSVGMYM